MRRSSPARKSLSRPTQARHTQRRRARTISIKGERLHRPSVNSSYIMAGHTPIRISGRAIEPHVFLMQMQRALTVFFLVLAATPAFSADKWLSIRFKDFLVVGNAGESDIRRVGRSLEQFRSALAIMFPKIDQTVPVPVTVMVFKN